MTEPLPVLPVDSLGNPPRDRNPWLIAGMLFVATFALYWQTHSFEFIDFDDNVYLGKAPIMQQGLGLASLKQAFTGIHHGNWHPVTTIFYLVENAIFGVKSAGPWHLVNAAGHAINASLFFGALYLMTRSTWRSAVAAAIFAIHPLRVESVAWVAELKDVLSGFFLFLTLIAYTLFAQRRSIGLYAIALVCYALGLMSKATLVPVPIILFLLDFWPLRRFQGEDSPVRRIVRLAMEKIPFALLAIGSAVATWWAQNRSGAVASMQISPLLYRLKNAVLAYMMYLAKFVWPATLAIFYPSSAPLNWWPIALTLLVVLTILFALLARKRPYLLVGWIWFLVALIPMIGVVQVGMQAMADRYTYVPLLGMTVAVVWLVADLVGNRSFAKPVLAIGSTALLIALACASAMQISYWHDTERVFRRALAVTEKNAPAEFIIGEACRRRGENDEAIRRFQTAVNLVPGGTPAYQQLGLTYVDVGRYADAVAVLARGAQIYDMQHAASPQAESIRKGASGAHANLGVACAKAKDYKRAIAEQRLAIELDPGNRVAHLQLTRVLFDAGQIDEAEKQGLATIAKVPDAALAETVVGLIALRKGDVKRGVDHLRRSATNANDSQATFDMALALDARNLVPEAVEFYRLTIKQNPLSNARNNLAWIEATHPDPKFRNGKEAVELAKGVADTIARDRASTLDTLAAAYAEAGDFEKAIATADECDRLATADGNWVLVKDVRARREFYLRKQPYREARP